MKFFPQNNNASYGNPQTVARENSQYEIVELIPRRDGRIYCAFSNRKPRKDSKFWEYNYLVWSLEENCQAQKP